MERTDGFAILTLHMVRVRVRVRLGLGLGLGLGEGESLSKASVIEVGRGSSGGGVGSPLVWGLPGEASVWAMPFLFWGGLVGDMSGV